MKKLLFFALSIIIGFSTQAQNKLDSKGQKTGHWEKNYKNGKLRYKGQFEKGYEVGEFTFYFPDGKKKSVMVFSEKGKKAAVRTYYKNGIQQSTGAYYQKKKDGVWKFFDKNKKRVVKQEAYSKGIKHGAWKVYYPNGKVATEIIWKNGERNGAWKEYFEDGQLKLSATFLNDKMVGDYVSYFINKKISRRGRYIDGKQDGKWISYNDNGSYSDIIIYDKGYIRKETRYKNGKISLIRDNVNHTVKDFSKKDGSGEE